MSDQENPSNNEPLRKKIAEIAAILTASGISSVIFIEVLSEFANETLPLNQFIFFAASFGLIFSAEAYLILDDWRRGPDKD